MRNLGFPLLAAVSIVLGVTAGAAPLAGAAIPDYPGNEYPKIRSEPTRADCLTVNGEFQRYYRTSECRLGIGTLAPWWFTYWPK